MAKVYKISGYVADPNENDPAEQVAEFINDCFNERNCFTEHLHVQESEPFEFYDEHPLNEIGCDLAVYESFFPKKPDDAEITDGRNDISANQYQAAALRTAQTDRLTKSGLMENAALGLCGESGEVADIVKKSLFQGHPLDKDHIAKELGDVAWYLAVGAYAIGMDLSEVLKGNIEKLKKRYPDGFDAERSQHRKDGDM